MHSPESTDLSQSASNYKISIKPYPLRFMKKFIIPPIHKYCTAILLAAASSSAEETQRIVTVGGAATEIVFALGLGESVVATDLSSIYPPKARELPMVGYVRNVSPEGILSMEPDLVIATGAFGPPTARQTMEQLDVNTLWLPKLLSAEDLRGAINAIAEKLKKTAIAAEIIDNLDTQLEDASERAQQWSNRVPKVLFLLEPLGPATSGMGGGLNSKADALIQLAGGQNAAHAFKGFKPVSAESLVSMNPDLILVGQSNNHRGNAQSIKAMMTSAALSGVNAIRHGAVHAVPLDDLAFGPRLGEAVLRWNTQIGKISKLD